MIHRVVMGETKIERSLFGLKSKPAETNSFPGAKKSDIFTSAVSV